MKAFASLTFVMLFGAGLHQSTDSTSVADVLHQFDGCRWTARQPQELDHAGRRSVPQPDVQAPQRALDYSRVDTVKKSQCSTHVMGGPLGWAGLGLRARIDLLLRLLSFRSGWR